MELRGVSRHPVVVLAAASLCAAVGPALGDGPSSLAAFGARPSVSHDGPRIVVHTGRRVLYVMDGADTLFVAPVATGMDRDFTFDGRSYHFATPRGRRTVVAKSRDPVWTVPEWHYYEKAARLGLEPVELHDGDEIVLSDGSLLVMRDGRPGRINRFGSFAAFPAGIEIIFDGRIYIPPLTSLHRKVHDALGPFKLDLGDGYLIHGTNPYTEDTIGQAVSHGCIRMHNDDLARLYALVPVGTPVDIV